jgi:hypothetical protein
MSAVFLPLAFTLFLVVLLWAIDKHGHRLVDWYRARRIAKADTVPPAAEREPGAAELVPSERDKGRAPGQCECCPRPATQPKPELSAVQPSFWSGEQPYWRPLDYHVHVPDPRDVEPRYCERCFRVAVAILEGALSQVRARFARVTNDAQESVDLMNAGLDREVTRRNIGDVGECEVERAEVVPSSAPSVMLLGRGEPVP